MNPTNDAQDQNQTNIPEPTVSTPPPIQPPAGIETNTGFVNPKSGKQKSKLGLIIIAVFSILAVVSAILFFTLLRSELNPEQMLAKALENSLSTKTITQKYETKMLGATIKLDARTDFTDPAKAKFEAPFSMSGSLGGLDLDVAYDVIALPDNTYSRLKKLDIPQSLEVTDQTPLKDKWVDTKDNTGSLFSEMIAEMAESIRTPRGEVICGNFSSDLRAEIMQKIADDKIYIIKESSTVTREGKKLLKLRVVQNAQKTLELNDMVAKRLSIEGFKPDYKPVTESTLYIDTKLERIVRVEAKSEEGDDIAIDYSGFDEPLDITKPADALTAEQVRSALGQDINDR